MIIIVIIICLDLQNKPIKMFSGGKLLLSLLCTALIVLVTVNIPEMEFNMDHDMVQPMAMSRRDNGLTVKIKEDQARGAGALDNQAMETSVEEQYNDDVNVTDVKTVQYQEQRNQLSQALIKLSQQFHQYQCTVATGPISISSSGGWCPREEENYRTDRDLSVVLVSLFHTETVAGFGDGGGGYKKKIQAAGLVQRYDSFDGAPFCENITGGAVKYLDLSIPVYGLPLWRRIGFIISVIDRGRNHFDRGRNHFDRGRNHFDRGRILFDRGRILFDRGQILFDRGRILFDRGRIHFDRGRIHFDRGRNEFDRGRIHFKSHTSANHKASYKDPVYLYM